MAMVKSATKSNTTTPEREEFLQALTTALEASTPEARDRLFDAMQNFGVELAGAAEVGGDALSLLLDITDSIDEAILFEPVVHERRKAC
jgi:hypothetical protein